MRGNIDIVQLRKTAVQLGLTTDFVKKDYFVTQALRSLMGLQNDHFSLIFQGGTSLSKGYALIYRMSEDVDFRVIQKPAALALSANGRRKLLRSFRHDVVENLCEAGFDVSEDAIQVLYEGRFMSIRASFPEADKTTYLRPYIAIECYFGEMVLKPCIKNITTLIKETLGKECSEESFAVPCLALDETAAEKWVALTRRVANSQIKTRDSDKHLVRHLYDLFRLQESGLLIGSYRDIAQGVIEKDRAQFKKQNSAYFQNPIQTSVQAIEVILQEPQWREHWDEFLEQMVYEPSKPTFEEVCHHLMVLSQGILQGVPVK